MAIEKKLKVSMEEISEVLGISLVDLNKFIDSQNIGDILTRDNIGSKLAVTVINEYHSNLKELVKINKRSTETWSTYNNFIKRLSNYLDENCPNLIISELNEIILFKAIKYKINKEISYAPKTLNKYNAIMRSIMSFAYELNYTQKDLSKKFKIDSTTLVPRYIKDEDINKILNIVSTFSKPFRCRAMIIFLLGTGCRVSEISKIKLKHFDIKNDLIFIEKGKGNKERYIPMFKEVKVEILEYLKKSGMYSYDQNCKGYLFARDEGLERSRNFPIRTIEHLVERIRNRLPDINYFTAHTFRHTFAVKCLKSGISLHNLTLILGHTDPKTTMIYTQLYNEDLKEQITEKFPFPFENLLDQII